MKTIALEKIDGHESDVHGSNNVTPSDTQATVNLVLLRWQSTRTRRRVLQAVTILQQPMRFRDHTQQCSQSLSSHISHFDVLVVKGCVCSSVRSATSAYSSCITVELPGKVGLAVMSTRHSPIKYLISLRMKTAGMYGSQQLRYRFPKAAYTQPELTNVPVRQVPLYPI